MVAASAQLNDINVLVNQANWAWPQALRCLFQPRGVNLLVANDTSDIVSVLAGRRIHTAIIDGDTAGTALAMIKVIHMGYPLVPCILLSSTAKRELLDKALELEVYSVLDKPVNMEILRELLNKLFIKKYDCTIFGN